jgi:hypothetical protein
MKHLLTILALLCAASLSAQGIVRTVGITYTNGAPTHTPSSQGSEIVYDITNKDYYEYTGSGWNKVGEVVDFISGSAAPNYTPGTFDSRLAINANAELYFYNTSTTAWQKISLNEPLASLTFSNNTAATSARRLQYNDDVGDFVFGGIGGVQLEATQKHVWYVRNAEATTLNAGEVVYAFGTLGNSGRITVKRFLANGSIPSKYVVGIVGASIAAGQDGYVVDFGKIRGINTNAFDEGDILYPSATVAGQLTKTEPAAPNARMPIAFVVTKSATVGAIAVRLNGGGKLADIHDVAITTTPTNGQVLTYNDTTNVWRAVTPAPGITDLTFTGSASPFTLNSSTGTDVTFAQSGIVTLSRNANELTVSATEVDGSVTNEGSLTVLAGTATTSVIRSNTSGSTDVTLSAGTGIGLTEAGNTITVTNSAPDQTVSIAGAGIAVVTGTYPSFTVTATEVDGSISNEGILGVGAGGSNDATITTNTSTGSAVTVSGGYHTLVTETTNSNGGTINIATAIDTMCMVIACSDETSNLTTGMAKVTFRAPFKMKVTAVRLNVNTSPAGADIIVNIKEAGNTLFSVKPQVDAGQLTSTSAPTFSDTDLADNAEMTIDIDQVGSSTAGKGLKVHIYYIKQY